MTSRDATAHPQTTEQMETYDTVEIVRRRLASGRSIADADVQQLVAEIDRLRKRLAVLEGLL